MLYARKRLFVRAVPSASDLGGIDHDMLDRYASKSISNMYFPVPGYGHIDHFPAMGCTTAIALSVIIDQQVPSVGKSYRIGSGIGIGQGRCHDQISPSSPVS